MVEYSVAKIPTRDIPKHSSDLVLRRPSYTLFNVFFRTLRCATLDYVNFKQRRRPLHFAT